MVIMTYFYFIATTVICILLNFAFDTDDEAKRKRNTPLYDHLETGRKGFQPSGKLVWIMTLWIILQVIGLILLID